MNRCIDGYRQIDERGEREREGRRERREEREREEREKAYLCRAQFCDSDLKFTHFMEEKKKIKDDICFSIIRCYHLIPLSPDTAPPSLVQNSASATAHVPGQEMREK